MEKNIITYKDYYNEEYIQIIKSIIPENQYDAFTPLVYDILLRRAYTFNQNEDEVRSDAQKVINHLLEIVFAEQSRFDQYGENGDTLAHYIAFSMLIELNVNCYENSNFDNNQLYSTLTHEIYHAIATRMINDRKFTTGLTYYDKNGYYHGVIFNEIFNEAAADLASSNRNLDNDINKGYHQTTGYSSITFFAPLLAYTFGIEEKELYKAGMSDRKQFYEFLSSKLPETERENFCKSLDQVEFYLFQVRKICNKKDRTDEDLEILEDYLQSIGNFAFKTMQTLMVNDNRYSFVNNKDYLVREIRINDILRSQRVNDGLNANDFNKNYSPEYFKTRYYIMVRWYIAKLDSSYSQEDRDELFKIIQDNILEKEPICLDRIDEYVKLFAKDRSIPKFEKLLPINIELFFHFYDVRNYDNNKVYDNTEVSKMVYIAYREYVTKRLNKKKRAQNPIDEKKEDVVNDEAHNDGAINIE